MDFSTPLNSVCGCVWSADGKVMITTSPPRITLWSSDKCTVLAVFPCQELSQVDKVSLSPDNQLLLAASYKLGLVLVFSLQDADWRAKIECGAGGLVGVAWGSDSRHILTMAEWATILTVWSLSSQSVRYVRNPKMWTTQSNTVLHNRNKDYSFIMERRDCRDVLNIFSSDWQLVRQVSLDTEDCAGAVWNPSSDNVAVWDTCLYYRVQVVSLDGRIVWDYSAYEHQLGVRSCTWSPDGRLLAIASYDNRIRIFCSQFWSLVHDIDHVAALYESDPVTCRAHVYNEDNVETSPDAELETRLALEMGGATVGVSLDQTKYVTVNERPVYLDFAKPDHKKPSSGNIRVGVSMIKWSCDGRYIASKCENLPTTVWIWDIAQVQLISLLVHTESIKELCWDPLLPRLAMVTGGASVYIWSPLGALVARIPSVIRGEVEGVNDVSWAGRSGHLALSNKSHVILCKLTREKISANQDADDSELDMEPSREDNSI